MALRLTFFRCASCPPCEQQGSILDQVKGEAPGDVEFRETRTNQDADQATRYRVTAHPTIVLERGGAELKRWTAVVGKLELLAALRSFLGPVPPAVPPTEVPSGPVAGQLPGRSEVPPLRPPDAGPGQPPDLHPPGP